MNPHRHERKRRGRKRGHYRMCKYCFNSSVRGQSLCSECLQRPKEENKRRLAIVNARATLDNFRSQKNISSKNLKTIKSFCKSDDPSLREYARLVLEIGQRFHRKKKRFQRIRQSAPELYQRMRDCSNFCWWDYQVYEPERDHVALVDSQFDVENLDLEETWLMESSQATDD